MKRFACGYVISFDDGGPNEGQILHIGTKEDCMQLSEMLPAVSYSGDRPLKSCEMVIVQLSDTSED